MTWHVGPEEKFKKEIRSVGSNTALPHEEVEQVEIPFPNNNMPTREGKPMEHLFAMN